MNQKEFERIENTLRESIERVRSYGQKVRPGPVGLWSNASGIAKPFGGSCCILGSVLLGRKRIGAQDYVSDAAVVLVLDKNSVQSIENGFEGLNVKTWMERVPTDDDLRLNALGAMLREECETFNELAKEEAAHGS